jgi:DNA helicase HerA-like ATPase
LPKSSRQPSGEPGLILHDRNPFYLFVDEFQNFAMASFTKLLSGSRKFGLRITIAEQSTSQQSDRNIVDVILANTGTVICFRTASPVDEALMLKQFAPEVRPGEIAALPRYHFYIKLSSREPETPFSGITLPMEKTINPQLVSELIDSSRTNYAIRYNPPNAAPKTNQLSAITNEPEADLGLLA